MRILIMAIALAFAMIQPVSAAVYQQGVIYVIYEENVIKDNADLNSNDVPDYVEDMATQVNAAREVFKDVFDFPDPLESERFKNVTSIEVDIEDKEIMERNGQAFSGVRKNSKHDPDERSLHIKVANTVNPQTNATPEHEYFHLIQYGATYFRNGWFLEGMARWSEDSVSKINQYPSGSNVSDKLKNKGAMNQIFQEKYTTAKTLWFPLAIKMKDKVRIPENIMKKYRYVDGTPVFHDDVIYGANVMLAVIREMKSKEEVAAENFGGMAEWRKNGQRDEQNNEIIMDCVRNVYYSIPNNP